MRVKKNNRISRRMDAFQIILYVIVAVYCLSMVYVLLFGLINSLKDATDFEWLNPFGFPHKEFGWKFDNYSKVLKEFKVSSMSMGGEEVGFMGMFVNSLLYAVFMSLFSMATQIMVAYAIAKYDFRLKPLLYGVAVIVMLLPIIGSLASEVQMADTFNFRNNLLGICLMKCKYAGLYFLVFYATFRSVSWTYAEAAQIDGAGHLKIFIEIMLPLIKSTVFAVFILLFLRLVRIPDGQQGEPAHSTRGVSAYLPAYSRIVRGFQKQDHGQRNDGRLERLISCKGGIKIK